MKNVFSLVFKYLKLGQNVLLCFTAPAYYIIILAIKVALVSQLKFG